MKIKFKLNIIMLVIIFVGIPIFSLNAEYSRDDEVIGKSADGSIVFLHKDNVNYLYSADNDEAIAYSYNSFRGLDPYLEFVGDLNVSPFVTYDGWKHHVKKVDSFHNSCFLNSLTLPESVEEATILQNSLVKEVYLNEGLKRLGGIKKIGKRYYDGDTHDSMRKEYLGEDSEYTGSLSELIIPSTVEIIESGSISECEDLETVVLHENIRIIEDGCFTSLPKLESITIPESVVCIGDGAFADCTSLTKITIPENVSYIGKNVFRNCTSLKTVILECEGLDLKEAFMDCPNITTVVAKAFISAHSDTLSFNAVDFDKCILYTYTDEYSRAEGWNRFVNIKNLYYFEEDEEARVNQPEFDSSIYKVSGNTVTSLSAMIIYNNAGLLVANLNPGSSMTLPSGLYIWNADKSSGKFVIK